MKKVLPIIISLLVAIGIFAYSYFMYDRKEPTIEVIKTPILACNIGLDDLLDFVRVPDDDLKTLFLEETDMMDILETGKATYVAIDSNNNISKLKINVEFNDELKNIHIEEAKPLKITANSNFNLNEYFVIANECGFSKRGEFSISGVDCSVNGEYSAVVSSKIDECDDINVLFSIIQEGAPTVHLEDHIIYAGTNERFSTYYFNRLVDDIYDDNDTYLQASTNWKDVLVKNDDGRYSQGEYIVTYYVTDSDDNIGKSTLKVIVDKDYDIVEIVEENLEEVPVYEQ